MTNIDTLKSITNYSEKVVNGNQLKISYINFVENKFSVSKNREFMIDILTGERPDSDIKMKNEILGSKDESFIKSTVFTDNIYASQFNDVSQIQKSVFNYIDNLTENNTIDPKYSQGLDYILQNDLSIDQRHIMTRIIKITNIIAMESRIGHADILITHPKNRIFISDQLTHIKIIESNLIKSNKFILMKNHSDSNVGINLIIDYDNNN